jgi:hypothetical protein
MKNRLQVLAMACIVALAAGCGQGQPVPEGEETRPAVPSATPETVATGLVDALARGDAASAVKDFDSTMKSGLPPAQLEQLWNGLVGQYGTFKNRAGARTQKVQGLDAVFVTCEFERGSVDLQVTVNSTMQVCGLFVRPPGLQL